MENNRKFRAPVSGVVEMFRPMDVCFYDCDIPDTLAERLAGWSAGRVPSPDTSDWWLYAASKYRVSFGGLFSDFAGVWPQYLIDRAPFRFCSVSGKNIKVVKCPGWFPAQN